MTPLIGETEPFDVYMVDGRYRQACLLLSFLHASAQGADHSHTKVLIHDCWRPHYHLADHLLDLQTRSRKLCVYKRKSNATDEAIYSEWLKHYKSLG